MAATVTKGYTKKDVRMAELLKAVAHPARIAVIRLLAKKNTCTCGEIVEQLPIAQATVSQHIKALKDSGVITGKEEGASVIYSLNLKAIEEVDTLLDTFLTKISPER
ncbi:MAG: metalloregulator ArsR/SmtB family transcription factor [Bacteriodetes bacterium]|nr:metalloregulator ArsR/SmtB family transcription factor [Bacteroidota bacterium]